MDYKAEGLQQLEAMRQGVDYKVPVEVRGFKIYFRPLTMKEHLDRAVMVATKVSKLPPAARNAAVEHNLMAREALKLASTSYPGAVDNTISDPMLDAMTVDETLHLYRQYVIVMDKCNPSLEFMKTADIEELVELVKKNEHGLDLALTELSFSQLASLVRFYLTKND